MQQVGLPERSFKRRFQKAIGHKPIAYMQRLRVEAAKKQLDSVTKQSTRSVTELATLTPLFFNRLFKRTTGLAPGADREKFRVPLVRNLGQ